MNVLAVLAAYLLGSVPFTQILSLRLRGVDLRTVGTGTVSGTGLYRIAGLGPLVVGGALDVAKGSAAALLAGGDDRLAVATAAAVVTGHCWSVFLWGAGGRGLSPSMGALAVLFWPGAVLLLAGLALGRLVDETGLAAFLADVALVAALGVVSGWSGVALGSALVVPMLLKRLMGNARVVGGQGVAPYVARLLYDEDQHGVEPTAPIRAHGKRHGGAG